MSDQEEKENPQEEPERRMLECFGIGFGWFMEDLIGDYEEREKCYNCPDYERCYEMVLIKCLMQIRFEIRSAGTNINRGMGGSHSNRPFG